jgi:hypothetical protein
MPVRIAAALVLAAWPAVAAAQSASAPLIVTATVVSSCRVDVPRRAVPGSLSTMPIGVKCARHGTAPRVQLPAPRRVETRDALVVIDF